MSDYAKSNYRLNATPDIIIRRYKSTVMDGVTIMTNKHIKKKNKMIIIGVTGKAGTGKDSVGQFIKEYENKTHLIAFAEKLKLATSVITGLDISYFDSDNPNREVIHPKFGKSPRELLKILGTNCVRNLIHKDTWLNHVKEKYCTVKNSYPRQKYFVITDVRFDNEAQWVIDNGGYILQLHRDVPSDRSTDSNHETEQGVSNHLISYLILNSDTLGKFEEQVIKFVEHLK